LIIIKKIIKTIRKNGKNGGLNRLAPPAPRRCPQSRSDSVCSEIERNEKEMIGTNARFKKHRRA